MFFNDAGKSLQSARMINRFFGIKFMCNESSKDP